MNIYPGVLTGLLLLAPAWFSMSAQALFSADFQSGQIPVEISARNEGASPEASCYRRGYTTDGWTVERVGSKGYAAISPTFTWGSETCRNLMTLPAVTPVENTVLRWQAVSVYADFPDCLTVELYYPASGERVTGMTVDKVPGSWTTYLLPLERVGEEVEISFITGDTPGYILAMDDIFVGVPSVPMPVITSNPGVFYGKDDLSELNGREGKVEVNCTFFNAGAPLSGPHFRWKAGDNTVAVDATDRVIATGDSYTVYGEIPVSLDEKTDYSLCLRSEDDETVLFKGSVFASDYRRNLLVDEATGMWCNNCPEGSVNLNELRETFGEDVITLVTHQGDALEENGYWSALKFYAVPYFKLNRIAASAFSGLRNFPQYYWDPTRFDIKVSSLEINSDGELKVTVDAAAAEEAEVNEGAYGIGYAVTGDFYGSPEWYQKNSTSKVTAGPYYFLPTLIQSQLVKFHDVTLTSDYAFTPLPDLLPAGLGPEGCERTFSIPLPEKLGDWREGSLTVFVLNKETGVVMNARKVSIAGILDKVSVNEVSQPSRCLKLTAGKDGMVTVSMAEGGEVVLEEISFDGRVIMSRRLTLASGERVALQTKSSGCVVRAVSAGETAVCKILKQF